MRIDQNIAAIVTGGASGLGEAVARRLATAGARIALFDLDEVRGKALAEEIGGIFCAVDVRSDEEVDSAFARARAAHGQERVLVTCAGVTNGIKTAARNRDTGLGEPFPSGAFERVIQINLLGTFRCIARSAAGMLAAEPQEDGERGSIVTTASVAAEDGQIGQAAYAASKAAVVGMTLPIARDLMSEGIRINSILPGLFATPLLRSLPENVQTTLGASVPFPKRLGEPSEFAELAAHLIQNRYLNGESIRLDGALRMPPR